MPVDHDVHHGLHVDQGALPGEHPGRHPNPVIKATGLAWLEFEKPDLPRTAAFAADFGFTPTLHTDDELHLRGSLPGPPCVIVRKGRRSVFRGPAFHAADHDDLLRLSNRLGIAPRPLPDTLGGIAVTAADPGGARVRVISGAITHPALPDATAERQYNFRDHPARVNTPQRAPLAPAQVQRIGHIVLQSNRYLETLNWYLEHLGLIVSDFLFYPGQRARGPVMSFIRCDRGDTPADHHTLAMTLGPSNRYVHSAFQVADLDTLARGGEFLRGRGHYRSWGIGRHIQGSQIFDYWRDPDGFLVEHYADGDLFDCSLNPGWAPMTASGLAQWGPPATADFLGVKPGTRSMKEVRSILSALATPDNEFDAERLLGLLKVPNA